MPMLVDLLSTLLNQKGSPNNINDSIERSPSELGISSADRNVMHPKEMQTAKPPPDAITNDSGSFSLDQTPFSGLKDMISKSRGGDNSGPGVLRQLLGSLLQGKVIPNTGTVGGGGPPDHVPGTRQDAALNPTLMKDQRQPGLIQSELLPPPRMDYSQPSALDPTAIEQLRQSLLSDAGQLDPNNPNGLAGRMTSPNANADMNSQRQQSMSIEDSVRGFDGTRSANIKKGNNQ